jgi:hypothetical protein
MTGLCSCRVGATTLCEHRQSAKRPVVVHRRLCVDAGALRVELAVIGLSTDEIKDLVR